MTKLTTFSEANKQTCGQGHAVKETISPDKTFEISKQSQGETSFLGRHQRIHRGSKARKLAKK